MTTRHGALEALADRLEANGGDPARVDIVRRAERFKRSWVELAEGLWKLRKQRSYETWGYNDLHEYCQKELHLKAATLDKLLVSFGTLRAHAPEVLKRDGVSRDIPSLEVVDYFARALPADDAGQTGVRKRLDAPKGVLDELRSAVFDEGQSLGELRKRFDPILRPKSAREEAGDELRKLKALAERLSQGAQAAEGLTEKRVARVVAMCEALVRDLDELLEERGGGKRAKTKDAVVAH
jgi:hypothetical protein